MPLNSSAITLTAPYAYQRLDLFLVDQLTLKGYNHSRHFWQQQIDQGNVTSPSLPVITRAMRVNPGEIFHIVIPPAQPLDLRPSAIPLDIIYSDDDVIIINKAAGMVTHPAPGHWEEGTLVHALLHHCAGTLSGVNGWQRPGILHRLDKETSGLIIVAKNDTAHRNLSKQFQDRSLSRGYWGLVWGTPAPPARLIDLPMGRDPHNPLRQAIRGRAAREAQTSYRVEERLAQACSVTFQLKTGRTHQIRVHMAHIGHPLIGDRLYGGGLQKHAELITTLLHNRHALHAYHLKFIHPTSGIKLSFEAPIPAELLALRQALQPLF